MPVAFIQPDFDFVKQWASKKGLSIGSTNKEIVTNEDVKKRFQEEVDDINKKFGHWEMIKRFELTPEVWSIDGGELTPTLKLKRKNVKEKYQELYDKIYKDA